MKNKKIMIVLSAVLFITFSVYSIAFASDKVIKFEALPTTAQSFYKTYFSNIKILKIEHDEEDRKYEIKLFDRTTITFNRQGEWTEIDCDDKATIPTAIIALLPQEIQNKIQANYKNHLIVELKRNMKDPKKVLYSIEVIGTDGVIQKVKL